MWRSCAFVWRLLPCLKVKFGEVMDESRVVCSCSESFQEEASEELARLGCQLRVHRPGLIEVSGGPTYAKLSELSQTGALVFLRHMFPVQEEVGVEASESVLAERTLKLLGPLCQSAVAVQGRALGIEASNDKLKDLIQGISAGLTSAGVALRRKDPEVVVSILALQENVLLGVSDVRSALSSWSGGEMRLRHDPQQISRAEAKLEEALEVFGLEVTSGCQALDLGAAPGGWTKVLLGKGAEVTAVDPAVLDDRLDGRRGLSVYPSTAQDFIRQFKRGREVLFDLAVNDMRVDAIESAELMREVARVLKPQAECLITLKLVKTGAAETFRTIEKAKAILDEQYVLKCVRQLFYNRHEVSVSAQRRAI